MARYLANSPVGRLQHVLKTYRSKPMVASQALAVALDAMSIVVAHEEEEWSNAPGDIERALSVLARRLPKVYEYDFLFPWLAREIASLQYEISDGERAPGDLFDLRIDLREPGAFEALGRWAKDNRIDLTKTNVDTAMAASRGYALSHKGPPVGETVYEFGDGWTVQRLSSREQLDYEGEVMQNCLGMPSEDANPDYCAEIRAGRSIILSLRDPHGNAHATLEWSPVREQFRQVWGKGNAPPAKKYKQRLFDFIISEFGGEPTGLLMAGYDFAAHGDWPDWRAVNLRALVFKRVQLSGADLHSVSLNQSEFEDCKFVGANMMGASLSSTRMEACDMRGADLRDANLAFAIFEGVDLRGADLRGAVVDYTAAFEDIAWDEMTSWHSRGPTTSSGGPTATSDSLKYTTW